MMLLLFRCFAQNGFEAVVSERKVKGEKISGKAPFLICPVCLITS